MNFNNQWLIDDFLNGEKPTAPPSPPTGSRSLLKVINDITQVMVIAFLMYLALNIIIPRYQVEGHSMEPSFHSDERVVVSTVHYMLQDPQRGDIVVFEHDKNLIKRIIGLPGERVHLRDGAVYINGLRLEEDYINSFCRIGTCRDSEWVLGPDEYFVLGDNRSNSHDSHNFGPIHREQIIGRVVMRYWPLSNLRTFLQSVYQ